MDNVRESGLDMLDLDFEGGDREDGLHAKHESAVREAHSPQSGEG